MGPQPAFGSWQAHCPFHRLSPTTLCRKTLSLRHADDEDEVIRALKSWCVVAGHHDRQKAHVKGPRRFVVGCGAPDSVLEAQLLAENLLVAPAIPVLIDAELDASEGNPEGEVQRQRPARRGRGAARGGGRSARGRGRGAAHSDPDSPSD